MRIKTCPWARARLPLLAGGDSLGLDRWVVDRHLVRCADCRRRLEALRAGQAVLMAASADDPIGLDPPALWPDLARRLRQAGRPRPRTAWGTAPRLAWAWPVAGLAAGLLVALSIVGLGARHDPRIGAIVSDYVPIDHLLQQEPPRLLKPEDIEQFERHGPRPSPRPAAPYREAHASVAPEDVSPIDSIDSPTEDRVELTPELTQ